MKKKSENDISAMTYEEGMARLEEISKQLDSPDVEITQLVAKLKEAHSIIELCQKQLLQVEEEINEIMSEELNSENRPS